MQPPGHRRRLSKHHGLGNDFLVLVDPDGTDRPTPSLAVALCDRRTGVGADGLLWAGPPSDGADVTMELHNADGSVAEMSGNGIRCLAHAVARARDTDWLDLRVATGAGVREVWLRPGAHEWTVDVRVEMGRLEPVELPPLDLGAEACVGVSVGNPHQVALFADRASLDAAADGFARVDRNVEFVVLDGPDRLAMRVVERGVGETRACGTGACAAAWAAARWGLVGDDVRVTMPGGAAGVHLDGDRALLAGPSVHVADVLVEVDAVLAAVGGG